MGNTHTTKTINYKDGQHEHHQNNKLVYMLPIFEVNCCGGVRVAHF
jgi:hypothetical protein